MKTQLADHALQRFDGFGKPGEGFTGGKGLANSQTELAGASEPTVPRRERCFRTGTSCHRYVPCAVPVRKDSLSLGR